MKKIIILTLLIANIYLILGCNFNQNKEIIVNRINEYKEKTAPLKEYYLNQDKLTEVSGKGSVTEISKKLFDLIDAL